MSNSPNMLRNLQAFSYVFIWGTMIFSHLHTTQKSVRQFVQGSSLTAKSYFLLIRSFVNAIKLFQFIYIATSRTKAIESVLNRNAEVEETLRRCAFGRRVLFKSRLYLIFASGIFVICSLVNFLFVHHDGAKSETNPVKMFQVITQDANTRWNIVSNNSSDPADLAWQLGILEVAMRFTSCHVTMVVEFFFLGILPHAFWLTMMGFQDAVNLASMKTPNEKSTGMKQKYPYTDFLLDKFDELREFAHATNGIWANVALIWLVDHSMKFIFSLNDTLTSDDILNMLTALVRVVLFSGALVTAAEVYRRVCRKFSN